MFDRLNGLSMERRAREIIRELEETKDRLLSELSGVDKCTLAKLREIVSDFYGAENRVAEILHEYNTKATSEMASFVTAIEKTRSDFEKGVIAYCKSHEVEKQLHDIADTVFKEEETKVIDNIKRVEDAAMVRIITEANNTLNIKQSTGDLELAVMSQKATTDELNKKADRSELFGSTEDPLFHNVFDDYPLTVGKLLNGNGEIVDTESDLLYATVDFIPVTDDTIIRFKNIGLNPNKPSPRIVTYDENFAMIQQAEISKIHLSNYFFPTLESLESGLITSLQIDHQPSVRYVRMVFAKEDMSERYFMSINEEMTWVIDPSKLDEKIMVDYSQVVNHPYVPTVESDMGESKDNTMSQYAITRELSMFDDEILQRDFLGSLQMGFSYSGSEGGVITKNVVSTRAIFSVRSYSKDVFIIPKLGYMMLVHFLNGNNEVMESVKYWANGGIIPKNQRFAITIYKNVTPAEPMTLDEALGVVTIQNEEQKQYKRKICGAFLDGKFSNIAYSHSLPFVAPINTKEHYTIVAQNDGYGAIKGDIQITSDNHLVMCHDKGFTFDDDGRITTFDASNCTLIRNMTYEQVMALEHNVQYNDVYMHPTDIDGLLRVCKKYGKFPYITIRDENMGVIAPILVDKIKSYGFENHCIVNSFTLESLAEVRKHSDIVFLSNVLEENQLISDVIINRINQYGNVVITTFDNDGKMVDSNMEKITLAKSMGIRIFGAIFNNANNVSKLLDAGFSGCQSYVSFT